MKHGISVQALAAEVQRQQEAKQDFKARSGSHFRMTPDTLLELDGLSAFPIRDHAHKQIAEFAGIPGKYYETMRREAPGLLAANTNHWFEQKRETRLIRTLDGQTRALLSSRFQPLDNPELMNAALPALYEHPALRIESCQITPNRLYLKAVFPRLEFEVKKGDLVQFGLSISNSEIGDGSLEVALLVFQLICNNGMIVEDGRTRRNHVGGRIGDSDQAVAYMADETRAAAERAFFLKLRDTIKHMLTEGFCADVANKMRRAAGEPIRGNPNDAIEAIAKRHSLTEDEKGDVLRFLAQGGDMSQWGLVSAVTRAAQDVENYDRATELERIGGRILDLTSGEWQRVALAA
jgi:hypothetical protein